MHRLTTARLDLTENGLFTLAQGTRNIIAKLQEPITLQFFYSKKVAAGLCADHRPMPAACAICCSEYAALSHGKIILQEIDPEPFTPAEDEATAHGLTGAPTDSRATWSISASSAPTRIDGKEVIPFFAQEREHYLEYDLTSLIYHLSHAEKAGARHHLRPAARYRRGRHGWRRCRASAQPSSSIEQLQQTYDTQMLEPTSIASRPMSMC